MPSRLSIRSRVCCPSCWLEFHPAEILWVAAHPDLLGDPLLGEDALRRFLPSRFDADGFALDARDSRCHTLACPHCHLVIPRILLECRPLFLSVIGAPSCGKSYFIASSIWKIRQRLQSFGVNFMDADPVANQIISEYEKKIFLNDQPHEIVAIHKTEEDGELYQCVNYGTHQELYARPFVFALQPKPQHLRENETGKVRSLSRALCLYDNAGEHFQPKCASERSPATGHLARSKALLFVFDPLQHPRFRERCRRFSSDPQLSGAFRTFRQDEILLEAAKRIRQWNNLPQHQALGKPLIVVVNKFDVWGRLVPGITLDEETPYCRASEGTGVNRRLVEATSCRVRELLSRMAPEVVAACDSVANDVTFIPVSAQGCSPELSKGLMGVRPAAVQPIWAELPLLYAISRSGCKLVPHAIPRSMEQRRVVTCYTSTSQIVEGAIS